MTGLLEYLRLLNRARSMFVAVPSFVMGNRDCRRAVLNDINGATAIEYGLIIGVAAIGIAGGISALSDLVQLLLSLVSDAVNGVDAALDGGGSEQQEPVQSE